MALRALTGWIINIGTNSCGVMSSSFSRGIRFPPFVSYNINFNRDVVAFRPMVGNQGHLKPITIKSKGWGVLDSRHLPHAGFGLGYARSGRGGRSHLGDRK